MSYRKNEIIYAFPNGDTLRKYYKGLILEFATPRLVLSTSVLNGGIRTDLDAVFNYNCLADEYSCELIGETYEQQLGRNAADLGLAGKKVSGMSTAAWMELASVKTERFMELEVTAVVTGGVDSNGVRVEDPAGYYEKAGEYVLLKPGTINIMLWINQNLMPGTLARALVTCSEAKVTAVEELMIGSLYSEGIATGSGTDGTIIICDSQAEETLTDAGEHAKLGELIGKAVHGAVKEALLKQTGANGARQHKVTERLKRYRVTLSSLWEFYEENLDYFKEYPKASLSFMEERLERVNTYSSLIIWCSYYTHLLDQYRYELLEWAEVLREAKVLIRSLFLQYGMKDVEYRYELRKDREVLTELTDMLRYAMVTLLFLFE